MNTQALKVFIFILMLFKMPFSHALEKSDSIRIHVFDCGSVMTKDLSVFSDTGEYDGKSRNLNDPCFLIQHPKGLLLWDTGLGDSRVGKSPESMGPFQMSVSISLASQLKQLGVNSNEITYVAVSHSHSDHIGNAAQFTHSTWLWQGKELAYVLSKPAPHGVTPETVAVVQKSKKEVFYGDHDVFGDGKVKILTTPGHTPGHQSLLVRLEKSSVILSGDLYHMKLSRTQELVPVFNFSRAETLASMKRIETLAKNLGARVIIQHDPEDYASLPKFPAYLQ